MRTSITIIFAAALAGCAAPTPTSPSDADFAAANFGAYPSNSAAIIKAYYAGTLKDPDSATYRDFSEPKRYWMADRFNGGLYGYLVCATYNAKNSYGGYVGYRTEGFFLRDGAIVRHIEDGRFAGTQVCPG